MPRGIPSAKSKLSLTVLKLDLPPEGPRGLTEHHWDGHPRPGREREESVLLPQTQAMMPQLLAQRPLRTTKALDGPSAQEGSPARRPSDYSRPLPGSVVGSNFSLVSSTDQRLEPLGPIQHPCLLAARHSRAQDSTNSRQAALLAVTTIHTCSRGSLLQEERSQRTPGWPGGGSKL